MTAQLLALGFLLSLDNFRTSLVLGPLRVTLRRALLIAASFGFWDGVAPLLGALLGGLLGRALGPVSRMIAPAVLGLLGAFLLIRTRRQPQESRLECSWTLLGLPVPLSLDNIVAGSSLGLEGAPIWACGMVFGVITAGMSLLGLLLGRGVGRLIHVRAELLAGGALVTMAALMAAGVEL